MSAEPDRLSDSTDGRGGHPFEEWGSLPGAIVSCARMVPLLGADLKLAASIVAQDGACPPDAVGLGWGDRACARSAWLPDLPVAIVALLHYALVGLAQSVLLNF